MTHRHFILHKPYGFLSQFVNNQNKRKNKKLLGELFPFPTDTMCIGRLDENSEGLLLLTTDGMVSEQVRSGNIEKEYYVQVDGLINQEAILQLQQGIEINLNGIKHWTQDCKVKALDNNLLSSIPYRKPRDPKHGPTSWASITIVEGKFRQVRKMTAAAGFPTLRLIRMRIGHICLNGLEAGKVVEVTNFEFE